MPSEAFKELSSIPDGTETIQAEMTLQGTYNDLPVPSYQFHMYLIAYNEDGQVVGENQEVLFTHQTRGRLFSLQLKVPESAKRYKILFRVYPEGGQLSSGSVTISKIEVQFK